MEFDPILFFVLLIHFSYDSIFKRIKKLGSVYFSVSYLFIAAISYGGLGYVVPHSLYPAGYHCKPAEPLPFAAIASQKNSINLYHMGIYSDPALLEWFVSEYPKHCRQKLDMGKSCIRFKKPEDIPFALIGELMKKMSVQQWISLYESKPKN